MNLNSITVTVHWHLTLCTVRRGLESRDCFEIIHSSQLDMMIFSPNCQVTPCPSCHIFYPLLLLSVLPPWRIRRYTRMSSSFSFRVDHNILELKYLDKYIRSDARVFSLNRVSLGLKAGGSAAGPRRHRLATMCSSSTTSPDCQPSPLVCRDLERSSWAVHRAGPSS
jgi:hypothetical protein